MELNGKDEFFSHTVIEVVLGLKVCLFFVKETEVMAAQSEAAAAKELAEKAEVWCGSKTFSETNL